MSEFVITAKDGCGFWVPNEAVDLHARLLGARGLFVYCILLRSCTRLQYPSVGELASLTEISPRYVRTILGRLLECGLLNESDMTHIGGYTQDAAHAPDIDPVGSANQVPKEPAEVPGRTLLPDGGGEDGGTLVVR